MTEQAQIGSWRGVQLGLAVWDAAKADVDVSFACMFAHELAGEGPAGGLRHLDDALGGALTNLRREGRFRAEPLDMLRINGPPTAIAAGAIILLGLGDPAAWTPALTGRAAATAIQVASLQGAKSAAFAPSILDAGFPKDATVDLPFAMMEAVLDAIDLQDRVAVLGLAEPSTLRRWVFDVGAPRFKDVVGQFRSALAALRPSAPRAAHDGPSLDRLV